MNFQRGKRREEPEINLVPYIDVLLVILIFLMVTTTYSRYTELQINLPAAEAEKQLERPNEIAVVDARGFGNGWLLPAGPLREPPRRLAAVHAVVAHQNPRVAGFAMTLEGETVHCMADARERRSLADFRGQAVHAVAGIGDPNRFFLHLARYGLRVRPHPFPDHHRFVPAELEFGDEAPVLMTEKDAVKLRGRGKRHWWVLPVTAKLDPAFAGWLQGKLHEWRRPEAA